MLRRKKLFTRFCHVSDNLKSASADENPNYQHRFTITAFLAGAIKLCGPCACRVFRRKEAADTCGTHKCRLCHKAPESACALTPDAHGNLRPACAQGADVDASGAMVEWIPQIFDNVTKPLAQHYKHSNQHGSVLATLRRLKANDVRKTLGVETWRECMLALLVVIGSMEQENKTCEHENSGATRRHKLRLTCHRCFGDEVDDYRSPDDAEAAVPDPRLVAICAKFVRASKKPKKPKKTAAEAAAPAAKPIDPVAVLHERKKRVRELTQRTPVARAERPDRADDAYVAAPRPGDKRPAESDTEAEPAPKRARTVEPEEAAPVDVVDDTIITTTVEAEVDNTPLPRPETPDERMARVLASPEVHTSASRRVDERDFPPAASDTMAHRVHIFTRMEFEANNPEAVVQLAGTQWLRMSTHTPAFNGYRVLRMTARMGSDCDKWPMVTKDELVTMNSASGGWTTTETVACACECAKRQGITSGYFCGFYVVQTRQSEANDTSYVVAMFAENSRVPALEYDESAVEDTPVLGTGEIMVGATSGWRTNMVREDNAIDRLPRRLRVVLAPHMSSKVVTVSQSKHWTLPTFLSAVQYSRKLNGIEPQCDEFLVGIGIQRDPLSYGRDVMVLQWRFSGSARPADYAVDEAALRRLNETMEFYMAVHNLGDTPIMSVATPYVDRTTGSEIDVCDLGEAVFEGTDTVWIDANVGVDDKNTIEKQELFNEGCRTWYISALLQRIVQQQTRWRMRKGADMEHTRFCGLNYIANHPQPHWRVNWAFTTDEE